MTTEHIVQPAPRKPLRLWPGVVAVALQWLARFVVPIFVPGAGGAAIVAGVAGGLAVIIWWLFFSRAPWSERLGAIALLVAAMYATTFLVHPSIANGMMGMMPFIFGIPVLSLALVAWAVAGRRLAGAPRYALLVATVLLACGSLMLIRTGGISGEAQSDTHWRWTQSPEERLLAEAHNEPAAVPSVPAALEAPVTPPAAAGTEPAAPTTTPAPEPTPAAAAPEAPVRIPDSDPAVRPAAPAGSETRADWPGFRGPDRDSIVHGARIETDWSRSAPVELWRRPIGPGWSSFAVHGNIIYTQEQRGDDEIVAAYNLATGEPVWRHRDSTRFWESNGGAGPRGTPTLGNGRVYTLGATGLLNALDARTGSVIWSRNAASDTGKKVPDWGFAGSPLVVDDLVVVATAGRLAAYEVATGNPRWLGPAGGGGYSSPQLATIDGVAQILLVSGGGAISVAPADGTLLWQHEWPGDGIVQPSVIGGDVLLGSGSGMASGVGMRRVAVAHGPDGWSVAERWTSAGLKPYYNDFVVHKGHAYGFDGSLLACINLEDGARKWKGGRFGHGQLVLLADQDLLLVLSEEGTLALVKAAPDQFTEVARFPAIEGKTWNHPVLVGDVVLARNGEEMAAFRVSVAGR